MSPRRKKIAEDGETVLNKTVLNEKNEKVKSEKITSRVGANKKERELSIEESFLYLDEAVKKLNDEDITLEESFSVFESAMRVLKECSQKIDEVEKKVQVISSNAAEELE